MKKYLPLIIFVFGLIVLVCVYFFVIKPSKKEATKEEVSDVLIEVGLNDRPVTSLTPTADGHWLNLKIDKIKIEAASLDYELLYELPDGRTQGVPGTINLNSQKVIERKLLLGSESSGKFRYDEGVKEGTLTLRFRNDKGKMIARFTTKFRLLSSTRDLSSLDSNLTVALEKINKSFFVVMETFGLPDGFSGTVASGPYGLFSSSETALKGQVSMGSNVVYTYSGSSWVKAESSFEPGIFVGASQ
jgi:hypothetical protein